MCLYACRVPRRSTSFPTRRSSDLLDAMRHHLVSDVPVVLFLSGGTDSACLAAAARQAGAQNLTAMTVGFTEEEFDESEVRDRKSTRLNSSHLGISYAVYCLKQNIA